MGIIQMEVKSGYFSSYEDYVYELATDWFFLNMFVNVAHPLANPLCVQAEEDMCFDIWLDDNGNIKAGDLKLKKQGKID